MAKKFSYYTNKRLEELSADIPFRLVPYKHPSKLLEMIAELSFMLLQERIQRKELIEDIIRDAEGRKDRIKADYIFTGLTH